MNEKKLTKKELIEAIKGYENVLSSPAMIKTLSKFMLGAYIVRLGRLNAELKRRKK
jgi:hypothetical protein